MSFQPIRSTAALATAILVGVLLASIGVPRCGAQPPSPPRPIKIVVNYDDGLEKHFTQIPWREGMTVMDAIGAAAKHPRGIRFEYRGKGATAFLYKIDDLENEANGRSWLYRVNGKLADRGFAIYPLQAGDTVLWMFDHYR